jgi:NTP pyrophosphatase (non-canonical NTP hydrolase)
MIKVINDEVHHNACAAMDQYTEDAMRTEPDYDDVVQRLANVRIARLLHVAMGLVTEAGEFVDQLKRHIYYSKELDATNLLEELGDITWYQRIGADELEMNLIEILDRNVAKLKVRYPGKFSQAEAENRNLEAERKTLE